MSATEQRPVNICQYRVKPGHEAEMETLLQRHWPTLRAAGLASEDPPQVFRGLPSPSPDGEHDAARVYIEIFSWQSADSPRLAHESPEVMSVWEPMGAICESMDFPSFQPLDPPDPISRSSDGPR